MTNIKQIATDMGVSVATVSNALTGKGRVSSEMVERIKQRASDLGYRPSLAGRALRSGQSGILGLVMPDLTNPLFPRIAQNLSLVADDRQLGILIADSRGNPDEQMQAIERLLDRGVDGLLIVPQKGTAPGVQRVPTVIINTASDPDNTVSADHAGGGKLIAEHIAELGHRHVVILGEDRVSEVQRDRVEGCVRHSATQERARVLGRRRHAKTCPRDRKRCDGDPDHIRPFGAAGPFAFDALRDCCATRCQPYGFRRSALCDGHAPQADDRCTGRRADSQRGNRAAYSRNSKRPPPAETATIPMRLVARNSTSIKIQ